MTEVAAAASLPATAEPAAEQIRTVRKLTSASSAGGFRRGGRAFAPVIALLRRSSWLW